MEAMAGYHVTNQATTPHSASRTGVLEIALSLTIRQTVLKLL